VALDRKLRKSESRRTVQVIDASGSDFVCPGRPDGGGTAHGAAFSWERGSSTTSKEGTAAGVSPVGENDVGFIDFVIPKTQSAAPRRARNKNGRRRLRKGAVEIPGPSTWRSPWFGTRRNAEWRPAPLRRAFPIVSRTLMGIKGARSGVDDSELIQAFHGDGEGGSGRVGGTGSRRGPRPMRWLATSSDVRQRG